MRECFFQPVVMIDCPRNRIRVHRNALHLLGDPDYILLMVNPKNLTFAILPSAKRPMAHAVTVSSQSVELYSKSLIRQLCRICPGWNGTQKLRMAGEYIREENLVRFYLMKAEERNIQP